MRFFYLRNEHGHPIGCVASDLVDAEEVHFALSVCNPLDRFHRHQARALAAGRLSIGPFSTLLMMGTKGQVKQTIMASIADDSNAPTRARDAANRWLMLNSNDHAEGAYNSAVAKAVQQRGPKPTERPTLDQLIKENAKEQRGQRTSPPSTSQANSQA